MKILLTSVLFGYFGLVALAQSDNVASAESALAAKDFVTAYDNANTALQSPKSLDKASLAKAYYVRGKAGVKLAYDAIMEEDATAEKKYIEVPLQAYRDYKQVNTLGDSTLKKQALSEYTKLGNTLMVAGTRYDEKFKESGDHPDSSLLEKGIENFTASIDVFALIKTEKFKPYLFRGDVYFAKQKFSLALADYTKAMELFEDSPRENPDFNIGDLGYRLAYMQAAVYNKTDVALQIIIKTRKLLDGEMTLATSKKEKLGAERYDEYKKEYDYFISQLDDLNLKLKQ